MGLAAEVEQLWSGSFPRVMGHEPNNQTSEHLKVEPTLVSVQ